MYIPGYDTWRFALPHHADPVGCCAGDACNRFPEPDEDAPRNYRPRPCNGTMIDDEGVAICDTCGELA